MWKAITGIFVILTLAGCNMVAITETPVSIAPSSSPTEAIATTVAPTNTETEPPTATQTPTETATATLSPTMTLSPTITPTASITPAPEIPFFADQLSIVDTMPDFLIDGIDSPLILFTNSNNQSTIRNIATAQPENTVQILYVTQAGSLDRTAILELEANEDNLFFPAANGNAIAYFLPRGVAAGLYILNIVSPSGFSSSTRIWTTTALSQRGILSEPVWTSDGEALAVTLQTAYDLDIFLYPRDGAMRTNITDSPSYDFWPAFSPDGHFMAFVSDRATCPSWNPADANACDALTEPAPYGGTVYLMDLTTNEVRQVSDQFVTEPPRWINDNLLVIAAGDQTDLLNPQRSLYLANIGAETVEQVQMEGDSASVQYLSDAWSPDGTRLIFQRATANETEIVLMTADGELIRRRSEDLSFPRFGVSIAYSPLGDRIALGGVGGRCPYGIRVSERDFSWVATGNSPIICNPSFSADGQAIVFTGVTSEVDGRLDIYSTNAEGFGMVNLTADLRGMNTLIGWIGR
jgi:Tol biopolymer transport system component